MKAVCYVKVRFADAHRGAQDVDNALDSFLGEGRYSVTDLTAQDARTLSAAPEILEALEATLAGLEAWVEIADDDDKRDSDNEAIAMARAAIAKAKGTT